MPQPRRITQVCNDYMPNGYLPGSLPNEVVLSLSNSGLSSAALQPKKLVVPQSGFPEFLWAESLEELGTGLRISRAGQETLGTPGAHHLDSALRVGVPGLIQLYVPAEAPTEGQSSGVGPDIWQPIRRVPCSLLLLPTDAWQPEGF